MVVPGDGDSNAATGIGNGDRSTRPLRRSAQQEIGKWNPWNHKPIRLLDKTHKGQEGRAPTLATDYINRRTCSSAIDSNSPACLLFAKSSTTGHQMRHVPMKALYGSFFAKNQSLMQYLTTI